MVSMGRDIYNFDDRLRREHERLEKLPRKDREVILEFEKYCKASGISKSRIVKYLYSLRKIAGWLGKPLREACRKDIERVLAEMEDKDYSAWTKHDYRVVLKRFYTWLNGGEELETVKWFKTSIKLSDAMLPEQLITEDEVKKMIKAAKNPRDKALIATLYESGARISELASMSIKDVSFEENYATIMVKGKTGSRKIILVVAAPYLATWIENHPLKDNPEAPLWISLWNINYLQRISYQTIAAMLKRVARSAGIRKKFIRISSGTPERLHWLKDLRKHR